MDGRRAGPKGRRGLEREALRLGHQRPRLHCILKKREAFRRAFAGFDPEKVAAFDDARIAALLSDPGIVRNRLKIESAVQNARAFLKVKEEFRSFAAYIWRFVDGAPRQNAWRRQEDVPAQTPESQAMSRDLYRRGFRFVGPTICYAFMQAVGMVNDHIVTCFRHKEVAEMAARLTRFT